MNPEDIAAIKANVQKLLDAGAPDEDIHAYLEASGLRRSQTPRVDASEEQAPEPGYGERLATHVLNAAQGIPGMEAVEAGAGMLGSKLTDHPMSYKESLETLRGATGNIGGWTSAGEKALGSVATLPFLPANPAAAGAILGAADQALGASPESMLERGARTAGGAVIGGLLGKGADMLVTAPRALLAKSPAVNLLDRQAARAASAKQLYGAALAEGKTNPVTPEIQAWLAEPDIAEIVGELQKTRVFKGVPAESPEMLDAVYKTLSDRAATVKKGLMAVTPNKPNIGRHQAKDIAAAQAAGLTAMDPTMPTYRAAVKDFAQHKAAEDAVSRGYEAIRGKMADNLPSAKNLVRTTPEAFAKWAETAGPDESRAAVEGILGGLRAAAARSPLKSRKAFSVAPSLLRAAGDATAKYAPRAGLLAARDLY